MRNPFFTKILLVITLFVSVSSFAKETEKTSTEGEKDLKTEIKEYIQHHLKDSHDFSLYSYTNDAGEYVYIGAPLPIILWDNGLKVFSSSKFHHGETLAEVDGNHYKLYHGKIYKTDNQGAINYDAEQHPTNIKPLDFSITKSVVMIFITGLLMFLLFRGLGKSYAKNNGIPTGVGRFFEPIVLYTKRFLSYFLIVNAANFVF